MARAKLIVGNWKMYTNAKSSVELAQAVAEGLKDNTQVMVGVCPPFPWLTKVSEAIKGSKLEVGAQNFYPAKEGAFTGEVSPGMLKEAGCTFSIVGHSERRHTLLEPDLLLNRKVKAGIAAGLGIIFCVGELLSEREAGHTEAVLEFQIAAGLAGLTAEQLKLVTIAYEPVWAIGTGKVATPQQAQEVHAFIRKFIAKQFGETVAQSLLIQYGGSVKPDNAAEILKQPDVDGALVGGASLKTDSFLAIVKAAY
ncbi:triose-phosphate isomerase [Telmatocola sphagniphila]|uniref:Triosephosphate isomerase n=1 Tax=Telmatocola sphagniphila TaxID=1123043 RepID=A0A8E6BAL9_9BACT|nr:triose-phosphate isomerase [Telmatocola sphagniphila]QVL34427.1 triose-phosphate isomerase [Telmatocola sphagniphila]